MGQNLVQNLVRIFFKKNSRNDINSQNIQLRFRVFMSEKNNFVFSPLLWCQRIETERNSSFGPIQLKMLKNEY